ncbi:ABC transporter substrate-binding protein [Candidatus Methanodesulfokora washburnensis]|uniref:CGP-CTERM sorting domain-containing protein n=1 Tax=Candidatus Methanodesulfokora washburnensis TaxID=2478471 RepID=A0A429GIY2_9CREN|nr:ABC transporter substrate-binding protein [Candidatus Methanodesulfokores washburnensis]RSN73872.1 CGP-CTERM sorting domain-containing protein [Candidatus Methanodesulfokores washburnensis]
MYISKRILLGVLLVALLFLPAAQIQAQPVKGPPLDEIKIVVRTSQETGIGDTATGKLDAFLWSPPPSVYKGIPESWLNNLTLIRSSGGSWSILVNPVHDDNSKYIVTVGGKQYFNPFAIREVRYALNYLINRKYIIDTILGGGGAPMYITFVGPSQPGYKMLEDVITKLGLTPTGDEAKGIEMINSAMEAAAKELGGRLSKTPDKNAPAGYWWTFDGEPVTVKFFIRIEDERHEEGLYIARQIEKAGIKVDRQERDRRTCVRTVYGTDPKAYKWSLYTEGWLAMQAYKYVEGSLSQAFAPFLGWMPGEQVEGWWQYTNPEIDKYAMAIYFGRVSSADQYWSYAKKVAELGLLEAVRIGICEQYEYYPVNKRVKNMAWDVVSGLGSRWALLTADTPDHKATVAEFSAQGALFMSAWNLIGGLQDVYTHYISDLVVDYGAFLHPVEGDYIPVRVQYSVYKNYDVTPDGKIVGKIAVPSTALVFDKKTMSWVNAHYGEKAAVKVTLKYLFSNWHNGIPMTMDDVKYWIAFYYIWSTQLGPEDTYYDSYFASTAAPTLEQILGFDFASNDTIVVYGNYVFPISDNVTGAFYVFWPQLPWEIWEAQAKLVAEGGPSGKKYSFENVEGVEWLDLFTPEHLADVKTVLQSFIDSRYVPPALKGIMPGVAIKRYTTDIQWINAHGHAWISNGPFYIDKYDPKSMYVELKAFRDPTYPFTPDYWQKKFTLSTLSITKIDAPAAITAGDSLSVNVNVIEKMEYPQTGERAAETAYVTVTLRDQAGNKVFSGTASKTAAGVFSLTIPSDVTKNLAAGAYTIEAFAAKEAGLAYGTTSSVQLIVKAAPPPPPPPVAKAAPVIEYFKAEPSTIQTGQSSTISWSVKNATSVKLNGEEVPAVGTKTVSPSTNTTYTLTASNEAGTTSKSLTITVVSPPPPPPPPPAGPSPALIGGVVIVIVVIALLAWYLLRKK